MTNLEAYMAYNSNELTGNLSLELYNIDPSGQDDKAVSAGLGMIDKSLAPSFSQGDTQETISNGLRSALFNRGRRILSDNGIEYKTDESGTEIRQVIC